MARAAVERYGRLDILCANAGVYPVVRIEDMTEQHWDRVLGINPVPGVGRSGLHHRPDVSGRRRADSA
jgi:NAD(P)-dependent dehydrogenase (short-subunit alcohol dehydrogenase family)